MDVIDSIAVHPNLHHGLVVVAAVHVIYCRYWKIDSAAAAAAAAGKIRMKMLEHERMTPLNPFQQTMQK